MEEIKDEVIYFTQKDLKKLKELYWRLSVSGTVFPGTLGANDINPWDALNTLNSNSISGKRIHLENILDKQGRTSKWKMNPAQKSKRKELETQVEFLDLAEGYAVWKEYVSSRTAEQLKLMAEREKVENTGLTRKQKLKRIDAALAKLEKEEALMAKED